MASLGEAYGTFSTSWTGQQTNVNTESEDSDINPFDEVYGRYNNSGNNNSGNSYDGTSVHQDCDATDWYCQSGKCPPNPTDPVTKKEIEDGCEKNVTNRMLNSRGYGGYASKNNNTGSNTNSGNNNSASNNNNTGSNNNSASNNNTDNQNNAQNTATILRLQNENNTLKSQLKEIRDQIDQILK